MTDWRELESRVFMTTGRRMPVVLVRGEGTRAWDDADKAYLDFFGGPALADNLAVLKLKGRLVILGSLQGPLAAEVEVSRILRNRLEIIGSVMRSRPHPERASLVEAFATRVLPALADGKLAPIVGATYPMASVADAHRAMEANEVFGKIVLTW